MTLTELRAALVAVESACAALDAASWLENVEGVYLEDADYHLRFARVTLREALHAREISLLRERRKGRR